MSVIASFKYIPWFWLQKHMVLVDKNKKNEEEWVDLLFLLTDWGKVG